MLDRKHQDYCTHPNRPQFRKDSTRSPPKHREQYAQPNNHGRHNRDKFRPARNEGRTNPIGSRHKIPKGKPKPCPEAKRLAQRCADVALFGGGGRPLMRIVNSQAFYAPLIGINNFKFNAVWMADDFSAFRHTARQSKDKAA